MFHIAWQRPQGTTKTITVTITCDEEKETRYSVEYMSIQMARFNKAEVHFVNDQWFFTLSNGDMFTITVNPWSDASPSILLEWTGQRFIAKKVAGWPEDRHEIHQMKSRYAQPN